MLNSMCTVSTTIEDTKFFVSHINARVRTQMPMPLAVLPDVLKNTKNTPLSDITGQVKVALLRGEGSATANRSCGRL